MKQFLKALAFLLLLIMGLEDLQAQSSIAKKWNEELLKAIRNSRARPTVHARNLYHWSILAHDCWAAYQPNAETFFLGKQLRGFKCSFEGVPKPDSLQKAQKKAISFASYRLLKHRYKVSPKYTKILNELKAFMNKRGYNINDTSTNYLKGNPAYLGNYVAQQMIQYGFQDGANEANNYTNQYYKPLNDTLNLSKTGTPGLKKPNHWQPLQITKRRDQAGNPIKATQTALSPEWGDVDPFALRDSNKTTKVRQRTGRPYKLYLDPGQPPYLDTSAPGCLDDEYKWGFCMVSIWQSHLDPANNKKWDVSPNNIGNVGDTSFPAKFKNYDSFFNFIKGGSIDLGKGYDKNPATGQPYKPQKVKRADYARILAEYWADGIASETPPGHWFAIYNKIENDPGFIKRWNGQGDTLGDLEYDVKAYMALGGAMHDAAIAAWSIKGWYDFVRPVSAIRWMASKGQCTDPNKMNFDSAGIPLIPGYIELVKQGDKLAGSNNQNVGQIKLYTWRGHSNIQDPETDTAGVGWILAGDWWPYQKPSFVTPPFPGYVSGHSTFSRAAANILTQITGSPYFPGGKSNFLMKKDEFLEHENGPSEDVYLQYAKYRDAADYTSLSRIWGGIHPPADDINGRKMGKKAGNYAYSLANQIYNTKPVYVEEVNVSDSIIATGDNGKVLDITIRFSNKMNTGKKPAIAYPIDEPLQNTLAFKSSNWKNNRIFRIQYDVKQSKKRLTNIFLKVDSAFSQKGKMANSFIAENPFVINTRKPKVKTVIPDQTLINDSLANSQFLIKASFNEPMDTTQKPKIKLSSNNTLLADPNASEWLDEKTHAFAFLVANNDEIKKQMNITIKNNEDVAGNSLKTFDSSGVFAIDTKNPLLKSANRNDSVINKKKVSNINLKVNLGFSKPMDTAIQPTLRFPSNNQLQQSFSLKQAKSYWLSNKECQVTFDVKSMAVQAYHISPSLSAFIDTAGNPVSEGTIDDFLALDTKEPGIEFYEPGTSAISLQNEGNSGFKVAVNYDEPMDQNKKPVLKVKANGDQLRAADYNIFSSSWKDSQTFLARFDIQDTTIKKDALCIESNFGEDRAGNAQKLHKKCGKLAIDLVKPVVISMFANTYSITNSDKQFELVSLYDKNMDTTVKPTFQLKADSTSVSFLTYDSSESKWLSPTSFQGTYNVEELVSDISLIDVYQMDARDMAGNPIDTVIKQNYLTVSSIGNDNSTQEKQIQVFPNPLDQENEALILQAEAKLDNVNLTIFTANGQRIYQKHWNTLNQGTYELNVQDIAANSIYYLRLESAQIQEGVKLITH